MKEEYLVDLESQKTLLKAINRFTCAQHRLDASHARSTIRRISGKGLAIFAVTLIPALFLILYEAKPESGYDYPSRYLIQNIQGDKIDTWAYWNVMDTEIFAVNIVNADAVSGEKLDAIKDAILSKESIEIEDYLLHKAPKGSSSVYYVGWQGAIDAISADTEFPIPRNFVILESPRREGEITIYLSTDVDSDGYTGYTKSTVDEGHILKSSITIYNVDELSADQIGTITRHEFGHALGLGHSSAPEDLMAPKIVTPYPYISSCNIDAISALYNGKTASEVTCSK